MTRPMALLVAGGLLMEGINPIRAFLHAKHSLTEYP
jgi:hypothetical protein